MTTARARRARIFIGQTPFDPLTLQQALDAVADLVAARGGGTVFTPNVDHVVRVHRHDPYRTAYAGAALALVDGTPVVWASRLLGDPLPEKVAGSMLFEPLLNLAARRALSVYFVGGRSGSAARVAARWAERSLPLRVLGASPPTRAIQPRGDTSLADIEKTIAQLKPDLVFVSLAAPEQEIWAARAAPRLAPAVLVCTGSAIDISAGLTPRAPRGLSQAGLEWAWRLIREPKRLWRRYLVDGPAFFPIVARQWLRQRRRGRP